MTNPTCSGGQTDCWRIPVRPYPDIDPSVGTQGCNPVSGYEFGWTPCLPAVDTTVNFTDRTNWGTIGLNDQRFRWNFSDGTTCVGNRAACQNPQHAFDSEGVYQVVEEVRSNENNFMPPGFYCQVEKNVVIQKPIPKWWEVAPR